MSQEQEASLPPEPPDWLKQLGSLMKRPEGTIKLGRLRPSDGATEARFQIVAGAHVFRIARHSGSRYVACHGSPGVSTRTVEIQPGEAPLGDHPDVWLAWSPESLHLHLVNRMDPSTMVTSEGVPSELRLWADARRAVVEVPAGFEGLSVWAGSQPILGPPAIDLWTLTLQAVTTLMGGQSDAGYMSDVVVANATLSMLVTGLESYSQIRFVELESEGLPLDAEAILRKLGTREERTALKDGTPPDLLVQSGSDSAVARALAKRFSFQDFDRSKTLFGRGYGLRFYEDLQLNASQLERVKTLLRYRHRVAHVSPLVAMHNRHEVPAAEPEFSGRQFAERVRGELDEFVRALHAASLRLRPPA